MNPFSKDLPDTIPEAAIRVLDIAAHDVMPDKTALFQDISNAVKRLLRENHDLIDELRPEQGRALVRPLYGLLFFIKAKDELGPYKDLVDGVTLAMMLVQHLSSMVHTLEVEHPLWEPPEERPVIDREWFKYFDLPDDELPSP